MTRPLCLATKVSRTWRSQSLVLWSKKESQQAHLPEFPWKVHWLIFDPRMDCTFYREPPIAASFFEWYRYMPTSLPHIAVKVKKTWAQNSMLQPFHLPIHCLCKVASILSGWWNWFVTQTRKVGLNCLMAFDILLVCEENSQLLRCH